MKTLKKSIALLIAFVVVIPLLLTAYACTPGDGGSDETGGNTESSSSTSDTGETSGGESSEARDPVEKGGSIVVIGDSLLDFWDNGEKFLGEFYNVVSNKAILATHVYDWLADDRNYPKILEDNPDEVMLGIGINDIKAGNKVADGTKYLKQLIEKLLAEKPSLVIHVVSVNKNPASNFYKSKIEEWNVIMREYCEENANLHFIDNQDAFLNEDGSYNTDCFIEDKLHFSATGYSVYEKLLDSYYYEYRKSVGESGVAAR